MNSFFAKFYLVLPLSLLVLSACPHAPGDAEHAHDEASGSKHEHDHARGHAEPDEGHDKDKGEHGDDKEHDGDEHGHGGEHGDDAVKLSPAELKEFGIQLSQASSGELDQYIELPAEIVINADHLAHVPPRLQGIVRKVFKSLGDQVKAGETLAIIESRELADAKAEFLAARERHALARASYRRAEGLWKEKISSEKEYLESQKSLAETRIVLNSARQKLHALGFSKKYVEQLSQRGDEDFSYYQIRAPLAGTIIEKHITLGETLASDAKIFTIADLSTVWVDIDVYQKDLGRVQRGQDVVIAARQQVGEIVGRISWVGPLVGESTRTATARVILDNPEGALRPGQFVTAKVAVGRVAVGVRIPKTALQNMGDETVVFVQDDDGFEPRPVKLGQGNGSHVEVLAGLSPGEPYVSKGAFTLKAQLSKGAFGDGHNH